MRGLSTLIFSYQNVDVFWITPGYVDYHWLAQGDLDQKFGEGFTKSLKDLILNFFVMIFLEHICLQNQFTIGATLARILKIYAISNVFFIKAEQ